MFFKISTDIFKIIANLLPSIGGIVDGISSFLINKLPCFKSVVPKKQAPGIIQKHFRHTPKVKRQRQTTQNIFHSFHFQ
jgi:hypothetical protein